MDNGKGFDAKRWLVGLFSVVLLFISTNAIADSLDALEQRIAIFTSSVDAEFSPQTVKRTQAYLGAAMLARDNHQMEAMRKAESQAVAMMGQARQHAADFRHRYADMLAWRSEAGKLRNYPTIRNKIDAASPTVMRNKAEKALRATVRADEAGDLNSAAQSAREVVKWSKQSVAAALPMIAKMSDALLSKMRAANGKYYAPTIYAAALAEQGQVKGFLNGSVRQLPAHPYHLLRLVSDGQQLTIKIKGWRKQKQSHEKLVLRGRSERRAFAHALGMAVAVDDLAVDIRADRLIDAIAALRQKLQDQQEDFSMRSRQMQDDFDQRLQSELAAQAAQLRGTKQQQLTDLKAAFQAKLERETHDSRQQAKLRKLFKGKKVAILVNLDGSILLRLSGLRFPSGRSALAADQLPLLGAVAKALLLYRDRSVHIEGHTDDVGEVKANRNLSTKRAEVVRDFLITSGIDAGRLKALGYGEVRPIASNEFKQGRAMNRRIDVVIQP
ncbi:MAG: OmpA family protein [Mariprofundales bacterium]